MRFTPKSEKQINDERFPLIVAGKYNFEVSEAKAAVSKSGNHMIVLRLRVLDAGLNCVGYVVDYLLESVAYKLRHICYACGLGPSYERGELDAEAFFGKTGTLTIEVQKDKTEKYPDKNVVSDYLAAPTIEERLATASAPALFGEYDI